MKQTFLIRADNAKQVKHDWAFHYLKDDIFKQEVYFDKQLFNWKNVWTGAKGALKVTIPAHDVLVLRLTPKK